MQKSLGLDLTHFDVAGAAHSHRVNLLLHLLLYVSMHASADVSRRQQTSHFDVAGAGAFTPREPTALPTTLR